MYNLQMGARHIQVMLHKLSSLKTNKDCFATC